MTMNTHGLAEPDCLHFLLQTWMRQGTPSIKLQSNVLQQSHLQYTSYQRFIHTISAVQQSVHVTALNEMYMCINRSVYVHTRVLTELSVT